MKKNTAPIVAAQATAGENQFWAHADKDGYIVGGMSTRRKPEGLGFLDFLRKTLHAYPIDASDIIGGDALTMLEYEQMAEREDAARQVTQVYAAGTLVACLTTEDIHISDSGLPFPTHPHAKREQPNNPTEP